MIVGTLLRGVRTEGPTRRAHCRGPKASGGWSVDGSVRLPAWDRQEVFGVQVTGGVGNGRAALVGTEHTVGNQHMEVYLVLPSTIYPATNGRVIKV